MIPRLTKSGRIADAQYRIRSAGCQFRLGSSRPSSAERLRQRRKARASAMRELERKAVLVSVRLGRVLRCNHDALPQSRGTTTGQLVAMHLTAEEEADRGGKWYGEQDAP